MPQGRYMKKSFKQTTLSIYNFIFTFLSFRRAQYISLTFFTVYNHICISHMHSHSLVCTSTPYTHTCTSHTHSNIHFHLHTHTLDLRLSFRVTENEDVISGLFVDSEGRLDLSRAVASDSGLYRCTGVDIAGASGSQLFNIEIIINGVFVL